MAEISAEQVKLQLEENLPVLLEKITKYEAIVKNNSDKINQLEEELKKKDGIITILKQQLEDQIAEGEKIKAQNVKESEEIVILKSKTENTLTRAKEMIFEKTKVVKNQELQIDALNQQIVSLKEVVSITKDLLEIRNLEVKQLEIKMQCMEDKIAAEKERQDLMHKKLEHMIRHNGELKREYETQLCLFSALRERYNERELARDVLSNAAEAVSDAPTANGLNNNTPPGAAAETSNAPNNGAAVQASSTENNINSESSHKSAPVEASNNTALKEDLNSDATAQTPNNDATVQTSSIENNVKTETPNNIAPVVSNSVLNGTPNATNNVLLEAAPATIQASSTENTAKTGPSNTITSVETSNNNAIVQSSNNTLPMDSNSDAAAKTPNDTTVQTSNIENNATPGAPDAAAKTSNNAPVEAAANATASVEVSSNIAKNGANDAAVKTPAGGVLTASNGQEPQKQPE